MAIAGGYKDPAFLADYNQRLYESGSVQASTGRQGQRVVVPEFPGGRGGAIPVPGARPAIEQRLPPMAGGVSGVPRDLVAGTAPAMASMGQPSSVPSAVSDFFRVPSAAEFKDALKIDATGLSEGGDRAGQKVAEGGREAGKQIEESAAFIRIAGYDVSTAIAAAAKELATAARMINSLPSGGGIGSGAAQRVNADTGRSMPPSTFAPR
jgi:hypothetical protein